MPFLVAAMPIIVSGAESVREELLRSKAATLAIQRCRYLLAWFMVISMVSIIAINFYWAFTSNESDYYPKEAVGALAEYSKSHDVVLFNEYGWGGYLAQQVPGIKVFIDGRMPHWTDDNGNSAMKDYVKILYTDDRSALDETINKWHINTVLITNSSEPISAPALANSGLSELLRKALPASWIKKTAYNDVKKILLEEGWQVEYEDNVSVLLVKRE